MPLSRRPAPRTRDQAHHLLDEADRAARYLGADRNLLWTAFGPTNVTAHRIAVAVELGDAGTAVAYASKIDLAALDLPERAKRWSSSTQHAP